MPYKLRIPEVVGLLPVRNSHRAQPQYPQVAYVPGFTLGTNIRTSHVCLYSIIMNNNRKETKSTFSPNLTELKKKIVPNVAIL